MNILDWVIANWKDVSLIATGLYTVASVIVRLTKTPKDDEFLAKIAALFDAIFLSKRA